MDNDPGHLTCSRWVAAAIVCAAVVSGLRVDEPPDGGQAPPPLSNLSLSQPLAGYNGALFTISVFGSYFNLTPG